MIKGRRVNVNTMIVTGFPPEANKRDIEKAGKEYADFLQEQVANLYDNEKVAGGRLRKNSKSYNEWKKKKYGHIKRGHLTGKTQETLDDKKLTEVKVRGRKGKRRCIITILRRKLYRFVKYIEHYENKKVPNETITAFKPGWARYARRFFKHLEA